MRIEVGQSLERNRAGQAVRNISLQQHFSRHFIGSLLEGKRREKKKCGTNTVPHSTSVLKVLKRGLEKWFCLKSAGHTGEGPELGSVHTSKISALGRQRLENPSLGFLDAHTEADRSSMFH